MPALLRWVLVSSAACLVCLGQIGKPPEFEERGEFRGAKGPAAIEGSAHVSGQGAKVNAEVVKLLEDIAIEGEAGKAFTKARERVRRGEAAGAVEEFRAGVDLYPESAAMRCGLAAALLLAGRGWEGGKALAEADEKLRNDRMLVAFAGELGQASREAGEQVLPLVREYVDRHPGIGQAQYYLGMLLHTTDAADAERRWEIAAAQSRDDGRPCLELGRVAAERGELRVAADWLREAVSRAPKMAAAHYRLGQIYYRLGERAKGDAHMRTFRELKEN